MRIKWYRYIIVLLPFLLLGYFLFLLEHNQTTQSIAPPLPHIAAQVTAEAAIVVDIYNDHHVFEKNIDQAFAPASTVKLLTALVALEQIGCRPQVPISRKANRIEPSKVWLYQGATYSVRELIDAVVMASANDASIALAEAAAGSEEAFAALMNEKARKLGAESSHFRNASGLPVGNQYTTAYDLSRIVTAALHNPLIYQSMKKKTATIRGSRGKPYTFRNHNRLVRQDYEPLVLVKTGYTRSARHCYAGVVYIDDREYALVILKSRKPWTDIKQLVTALQAYHHKITQDSADILVDR